MEPGARYSHGKHCIAPHLGTVSWPGTQVLGLDCLSKLGSILGVPIRTDQHTKDKTYLQYARLLIDITLKKDFPDYIEFVNDQGILICQMVTYEWRPMICNHCGMYGHSGNQCRKKKTRQEWRPKSTPTPSHFLNRLHQEGRTLRSHGHRLRFCPLSIRSHL